MQEAVEDGDLERTKKIARNCCTISDLGRLTILMKALRNKHEHIAKFLLEYYSGETHYKELIEPGHLTPLHLACEHGFVDVVEICIRQGDSVHRKEDQGRTPLFFAKDAAVAKLLLKNGAQVNVQDDYGRTPLHCCRSIEVAQLLLENGAQVHITDRGDRTPLHRCKDVEVARLLLRFGAPIGVRDKLGVRPLIRVLGYQWGATNVRRCLELIDECWIKPEAFEQYYIIKAWMNGPFDEGSFRELLKHGINSQAKTIGGRTALHCAVERGDVELVRSLKEFGIDVNARDNQGLTILHILLGSRRSDKRNKTFAQTHDQRERIVNKCIEEDLKILLEENPELDLNIQDNESRTPLHFAVKARYCGFVELLLSHGADPNIRDDSGLTPLMNCDYFTVDKDCIRTLLDYGADMFISIPNGNTIFHVADGCLQQTLVDYIVEHGLLMDKIDRNGNTALHFICATCKLCVVETLPFDRLDLTVENDLGETPLLATSKAGLTRTVVLLNEKDENKLVDGRTKDGLTNLHIAAVNSAVEEVEFTGTVADYLRQGMSIDAKDKIGKTALHYAIECRCSYKVRILLQNGADATARDNFGKNALYRAIESNKCIIVDLILSSGVDPTACLHDGRTPLHLASWLGHARIVQILNKYGVDFDLLDANGNTPLFCAMFEMDSDIEPDIDRIQRLVECGASLDPIYWIDKNIPGHLGSCPVDEYGEFFYNECRSLAIKVYKADLPQEPKFLQSFQRQWRITLGNEWDKSLKQCEDEVVKLKSCNIFGKLTYYDFLHEKDPSIAKAICDDNHDIKQLFVDFPLYGRLIKGKIMMDLFRNDLLLPVASKQLCSYLFESPPLRDLSIPPEIARRILINLSKNELFRFIGSVRHQLQLSVSPLLIDHDD